MLNRIDHFAVGTDSLENGMLAMKEALGVQLSPGGKHDLMGTHNCVMQSGDESFFELIAVDPQASSPDRPRWFTLDDPATTARLAQRPRALCWVVNTNNLDGIVAASPIDLGDIITFTRGDRSWRLTVPPDGHLPEQGVFPAFIEWSPGPHPSTGQADLGVRLLEVSLSHPDFENINKVLDTLQVSHLARATEGDIGLAFKLQTPTGVVIID
ncbi:VOC family protein [Granulosicoccus sp. 3-233]|uniref:VOC family protein n=1 Tax=Granulosicoccus sp. 3-233 TaxID=3417969 RepID=UPI003D325364